MAKISSFIDSVTTAADTVGSAKIVVDAAAQTGAARIEGMLEGAAGIADTALPLVEKVKGLGKLAGRLGPILAAIPAAIDAKRAATQKSEELRTIAAKQGDGAARAAMTGLTTKITGNLTTNQAIGVDTAVSAWQAGANSGVGNLTLGIANNVGDTGLHIAERAIGHIDALVQGNNRAQHAAALVRDLNPNNIMREVALNTSAGQAATDTLTAATTGNTAEVAQQLQKAGVGFIPATAPAPVVAAAVGIGRVADTAATSVTEAVDAASQLADAAMRNTGLDKSIVGSGIAAMTTAVKRCYHAYADETQTQPTSAALTMNIEHRSIVPTATLVASAHNKSLPTTKPPAPI